MIKKIVITPFQKFVKIESFSGILLFIATILAIAWANSPIGHTYEAVWNYKLGIETQHIHLNKPLILWVNDGLMTIFFFLIGLEIKRELMIGELNTARKAAFPLMAAIGGMVAPLGFYLLLNQNPDTTAGWGIPMATDIAFTLAILTLLGKRVPISLKVFLTAFAIVDDIGAVLVIAIFYSASIKWILLAYAAIPLLILFGLSMRGIYVKYLLLFFGIVIWYWFLKSGIHPTVAGVLLAFTVPIHQKINVKTYVENLSNIVEKFKRFSEHKSPILCKEQIEHLDELESWTSRVQSPLQHLEHQLHNWVAYFIMPIFALANAGVIFSSGMKLETPLILNLALCLVIGKCIGISVMSFLSVKLKIAEIPKGINSMQIIGVAFLAGVGFTMSIFIANLAFTGNAAYIDSAKVGILIGSIIAGLIGYTILRTCPYTPEEEIVS